MGRGKEYGITNFDFVCLVPDLLVSEKAVREDRIFSADGELLFVCKI